MPHDQTSRDPQRMRISSSREPTLDQSHLSFLPLNGLWVVMRGWQPKSSWVGELGNMDNNGSGCWTSTCLWCTPGLWDGQVGCTAQHPESGGALESHVP